MKHKVAYRKVTRLFRTHQKMKLIRMEGCTLNYQTHTFGCEQKFPSFHLTYPCMSSTALFYQSLNLLLSEDPASVEELKVLVQQSQRSTTVLSQPPARSEASLPTSTKMKDETQMARTPTRNTGTTRKVHYNLKIRLIS